MPPQWLRHEPVQLTMARDMDIIQRMNRWQLLLTKDEAREFWADIEWLRESAAAWLDTQDFYELCQAYRHAEQHGNTDKRMPTAAAAFAALQRGIREHL